MTRIYIDADACPVKDEVLRVARRHGLPVTMVGNSWMRQGHDPLVTSIVVPEQPDAADDWIAAHIDAPDIVVTADIPLAARCLERGAAALGPDGRPFTSDSIGMALAMRDLNATLRETGTLSAGGGRPFEKRDRSRFLNVMEITARAKSAEPQIAPGTKDPPLR
ncbi:MAG: YaiI/YqxD family protein [Sneathiellaceae bacterium]